jgi:2-polyprenyl-3-methyl-5-hydroxy-6-metoxy-1,4-benzoquinol methylase
MSIVSTVEQQYNESVELAKKQGFTKLGYMSNQVWHDDPRRLLFMLSRYKFVAKMLSGKKKIAEVGCGDAFCSRIVLQEVDQLHVYDIDPIFIDDILDRQNKKWPLTARVHDMLSAPLPEQYDAIYSLDVIEHIDLTKEHLYIGHIAQSLKPHGITMIGTPTLESQAYASPQSKLGHINCKSGIEFKKFLQKYFHYVFVFSMNDEIIHTGYYPMAHYLFGLCCESK